MRQIVEDVLNFVQTDTVGPTLQPATSLMDRQELGVICINLLDWWGRSTLMRSSHPYMQLSQAYPWCQRFTAMMQITPELQELVQLEDNACHFAPTIGREEWQQINDYVRDRYQPPLMTKEDV